MRMVVVDGVRYREDEAPTPPPEHKMVTPASAEKRKPGRPRKRPVVELDEPGDG